MVYDCFSFFNELDLLEIRLNTLGNLVDKFVLSESRYTHTGVPKPLYFEDNKSRFAAFASKIIHVVAPDPEAPSRASADINYSWACENRQRNATIETILPQLKPNDTLIISDLDEIPRPEAVLKAIKHARPARLILNAYCYYLNCRNCTSPFWKAGPVVLSVKDFLNPQTYQNHAKAVVALARVNEGFTATKARALTGITRIHHGGWHFTYTGGVNRIQTKLDAIVEGKLSPERSSAYIKSCMATGNDIFRNGERFFAEYLNKSFPPTAAQYPLLIFPVTKQYIRHVRTKRYLAYLKWMLRPLFWQLVPNNLASFLSRKLARGFYSGIK